MQDLAGGSVQARVLGEWKGPAEPAGLVEAAEAAEALEVAVYVMRLHSRSS